MLKRRTSEQVGTPPITIGDLISLSQICSLHARMLRTAASRAVSLTTSIHTRRPLHSLTIPPSVISHNVSNAGSAVSTVVSSVPPLFTSLFLPSITSAVRVSASSLLDSFVVFVKRTFQPSVLRRKRKTGFLARLRTRQGRKVMNRRRGKGRVELSA